MNLPIDKPRAVTALGGEKRWACRACARTHAARHQAEQCCAETVDSDWLAGGELLPRGHRTQRQVLDQLETRMAELEKDLIGAAVLVTAWAVLGFLIFGLVR